jgi:flavin reductase (DIM6/NTAB) family NADH-FMN oxidoreductase RutF
MKKSIGKRTLVYTHPVFVVGSYNKYQEPNIMTVSWGGICCSDPPCITVSVRKQRQTYDNIMLNKSFTVNIPSEKYLRETDFVGVFSGKNMKKFDEMKLQAEKSIFVNAPIVKEFPVNLICSLVLTNDLGTHTQFIGEILDVLVDEEVMDSNGLPEMEKVQPFMYDSASRHYYGVGRKLAAAYQAAKS